MKIKNFLRSAICVIAICTLAFSASAANISFSDVKNGKWYAEYVNYAVENNIFVGTSATTFSPNGKMTRAQFVQVFANLSKIDTTNKAVTTRFSDVPSGKWYSAAVKWASENGIVSGMGDGTFAPNKPVTREQMCLMLVNYVENFQKSTLQTKNESITFRDDGKIASWAKKAVYKCAKAGLVNGVGNNTFSPKGTTTRAQGATLFTNFHKYVIETHIHNYDGGICTVCGVADPDFIPCPSEPAQPDNDNSGENSNAENNGDGNINSGNDDSGEGKDEETKNPQYDEKDIITILDQNVRCVSDAGQYPGTTLENRHLRLKHQVDTIDPDVMGFQEVTPTWLTLLTEDYKDKYDYYNCFRESGKETGGASSDECEPVFWKKDRFTKIDAGHFWLGDDVSEPSIFAGQTDQHRICNWVKLKNKETGKQFIFASVHYSLDNKAREKSAAVMNSELKRVSDGKLPIIVVGDYNMNIGSPEYNNLLTEGLVGDLNFELDLGYDQHSTTAGYKTPAFAFNESGEYINQGGIIDFVMISYDSTGLYPLHYEVLQKKYGSAYNVADDYVSDHFGIHAKVVIPS